MSATNGIVCPPSYNLEAAKNELSKREAKRIIRKEIKNMLEKMLRKSLLSEKSQSNLKVVRNEDSLNEAMVFYGILTNSVTKEFDLIFNADNAYQSSLDLIYYTVSRKDLFTIFPAAGTYQGPYKGCKPIFVEVIAHVDDVYICKRATQLRYLELLSMKNDKGLDK